MPIRRSATRPCPVFFMLDSGSRYGGETDARSVAMIGPRGAMLEERIVPERAEERAAMRIRPLVWLSVFLASMAAVSAARAQGTGRSLDIDPSVRASGMGLASNAVFWDVGTNHWGNPALLGEQRGIAYEWGRTQLVPGLASDVTFTTNVVKIGG